MIKLGRFAQPYFLVSAIIIISLSGDVAASQVSGQEGSAMKSIINVIVRSDKGSYSSADSIKISASLENMGGRSIYVDRRMFWTGLSGGLELEIVDEHGAHLPARFMSDAMMPPPVPEDMSILIRLDSGFFYGTSVNLIVKDFFPQPGRYSIRVIYKSLLHKSSVAPQLRDLDALWDDTPQLASEPIRIDVTK